MPDISVTLPDGSARVVPEGTTVAEVAASIGPGLAKAALAGKLDGELVDVDHAVRDGVSVEIITDRSAEALEILRHSTAHVMAEAVGSLFPGTKFGIGPSIENGFYYDFDVGRALVPQDLEEIEARMREIIGQRLTFTRAELNRPDALEDFAEQPYKMELIDELPQGETISVYRQGGFTDLCRGPHVPDTGRIGAFKLTRIAGAYWRGDSDRPMLQRIYGTAWFSQADLDAYITRLEEAEKRDHRRLGKELDLFSFHEEAGSGLVLYHPKGARILRLLQDWERREHYARGYEEVITPHLYKADVWKTSGHYDFYREHMYFFEMDEGEGREAAEYGVKPMNCPGHVMIYQDHVHSYRDLPIRLFEMGTVYRHEKSGVVHGLMRARGFTQDDAHIFCRSDQVKDEVAGVLDFVDFVMDVFGFDYSAEVSTRPDKSIGSDELWELATRALTETLDDRGMEYAVNEGDGAFYGPKIDIQLKDAIGRMWQCSTIQVDFNFPERFELGFRTADNSVERPFMLHRVILGSMERFFGILIEHYAGAFPVWLSPVQIVLLPIADRHNEYIEAVRAKLEKADVRVEVDGDQEPIRVKIAKAQQQKVPYMLVCGDREIEEDVVSVRERTQGDLGRMRVMDFVEMVLSQER